jgi:hypothetical protein
MALPAHLLEQLPANVRRGELGGASEPSVLPLGLPELDAVLPDGGLPRGGVTELAVAFGGAFATSVALAACRAVQAEAVVRGAEAPWCAFVDPSGTLHGPGVAAAGVELERLLVVRPAAPGVERTAIRLVEAQAFPVVVVDTMGVPGGSVGVALGSWPRIVRRLAVAAEESSACVILVTDAEARRPLPLPVALRLELARIGLERLSVRVAKERRGRVSQPRIVSWARARAKPLGLTVERPLPKVAP